MHDDRTAIDESPFFTRQEFWAYCRVQPTKGKQILAENPELTIRLGRKVLIPKVRAIEFVARLQSGDTQ